MAVTPVLSAAVTGSLSAEASVVRVRKNSFESKGAISALGDLKSKTFDDVTLG